jgi:putative MFS transporter
MKIERKALITVGVAALGYFVDIFDLLLFSIVRQASLKDLGVPENELLDQGVLLINTQMAGLLVGGVLWGVLGDKRGRLSVLFGSIFLYSIANIANAFVWDVPSYAVLRFIAGVGLAGELGAAITLVSEMLPRETRAWGTTTVAAVGILGAVFAGVVGDLVHWRTAYLIGGGMGLALLVLRFQMLESGMFERVSKSSKVVRGDFLMLFRSTARFRKFLNCVLIGVPIWFVIGILITFSPELATALGVAEPVAAGKAVMWSYLGLSVGDLLSGAISQKMRSRKKVVFGFLILTWGLVTLYCYGPTLSVQGFYALCVGLGLGVGYWAVFVTIGAEQFGTNLRATVATSVPNFVRGSVVLLTTGFQFAQAHWGKIHGAYAVGCVSLLIAFFALWGLEETHAKDLDFLEES